MKRCLPALPCLLLMAATCRGQYEWRSFPDDPGQFSLFQNGVQVGGYSVVEDYYRPFDARTKRWGPRSPCPTAPPRGNFGVLTEKIQDGEHYRLNGREVSRREIHGLLASADPKDGSKIPDTSNKWRVTVIGTDAERRQVLDDFAKHPALAPWKDRVLAEGYAPSDWEIARAGFVTSGHPTIYVQSPTAQVLHRQDDYQGGPEALAEALRRIDPNYRPEKDRDRRKSGSAITRWLHVPWSVPVVALGALAAVIYFRRKL